MIKLSEAALFLITPRLSVPLEADTPLGRAVYVGGLPDAPRYTLNGAVWRLMWNGVLYAD